MFVPGGASAAACDAPPYCGPPQPLYSCGGWRPLAPPIRGMHHDPAGLLPTPAAASGRALPPGLRLTLRPRRLATVAKLAQRPVVVEALWALPVALARPEPAGAAAHAASLLVRGQARRRLNQRADCALGEVELLRQANHDDDAPAPQPTGLRGGDAAARSRGGQGCVERSPADGRRRQPALAVDDDLAPRGGDQALVLHASLADDGGQPSLLDRHVLARRAGPHLQHPGGARLDPLHLLRPDLGRGRFAVREDRAGPAAAAWRGPVDLFVDEVSCADHLLLASDQHNQLLVVRPVAGRRLLVVAEHDGAAGHAHHLAVDGAARADDAAGAARGNEHLVPHGAPRRPTLSLRNPPPRLAAWVRPARRRQPLWHKAVALRSRLLLHQTQVDRGRWVRRAHRSRTRPIAGRAARGKEFFLHPPLPRRLV